MLAKMQLSYSIKYFFTQAAGGSLKCAIEAQEAFKRSGRVKDVIMPHQITVSRAGMVKSCRY